MSEWIPFTEASDGQRGDVLIAWTESEGVFLAERHQDEMTGRWNWFTYGGYEDISDRLPTLVLPLPEPLK